MKLKPRFMNVKNTLMAFSTPIRQVRYEKLEDFNKQLAERILEMREKSPGAARSSGIGWHSDLQFLKSLGEDLGQQLAKMFMENVVATIDTVVEMSDAPPQQQVAIEAWATVNDRGQANASHIQIGAPWSGIYCVATDENSGGEIIFTDPRTVALVNPHPLNPFNATNNISVAPLPGTMLVFPAFLYNAVHVYDGTKPRITVGFNLR